jgi:DNA-binding NarL/FixJ family response regulator
VNHPSETTTTTPARTGGHNGAERRFQDTRPRLLIADDEPLVRRALSVQLEGQFNLVAAAEDSDGAIEAARLEQPDIAILDVQMPGGGLQAALGIREVSPRTAVVILSVDESERSVVQLMDAGAMIYLRKGAPAQVIAERLHQSIAAHHTINLV